jgi:hypothetical protein
LESELGAFDTRFSQKAGFTEVDLSTLSRVMRLADWKGMKQRVTTFDLWQPGCDSFCTKPRSANLADTNQCQHAAQPPTNESTTQ